MTIAAIRSWPSLPTTSNHASVISNAPVAAAASGRERLRRNAAHAVQVNPASSPMSKPTQTTSSLCRIPRSGRVMARIAIHTTRIAAKTKNIGPTQRAVSWSPESTRLASLSAGKAARCGGIGSLPGWWLAPHGALTTAWRSTSCGVA